MFMCVSQKASFLSTKVVQNFPILPLIKCTNKTMTDLIKGVGGSLREDESALLRWELCSNDLAHMIDSFEELIWNSDTSSSTSHKHHEDTVSFRNNFVSDVNKLVQVFTMNPFEATNFTAINNISISFSADIICGVNGISSLGEKQCLQFWNERLIQAKIPIKAKIQNNNIKLPGHHNNPSDYVKDPTLTASMFSKLRSANFHRPLFVKKLFENEIFGIAPSISTKSLSLYHGK